MGLFSHVQMFVAMQIKSSVELACQIQDECVEMNILMA